MILLTAAKCTKSSGMDMKLDVISNIDALLRARGRSWRWLVQECNKLLPDLKPTVKLSDTRCSRWKDGRGWPKPIHLSAMARVLDVPPDRLLSEEPDAPIPPDRTPEERMLLDLLRREPNPIGVEGAMKILWDAIKERGGRAEPPAPPGAEPGAGKLLGQQVVEKKRPVGRPRKPKPKPEGNPGNPGVKVYIPAKGKDKEAADGMPPGHDTGKGPKKGGKKKKA